jgi:hypothetical protein
MLIRRGLILCAAVFATRGAVVQVVKPTQTVEPTFAVTIRLEPEVVKVNSEIRVKTTLINKSNGKISFERSPEDMAELEFQAYVRDSHGNPAPLTEYGRHVLKGEGDVPLATRFGGFSTLQPAESLKCDVVITRLYDLSQPGKYTIQVERIHDSLKMVAKSNTITVTVIP